jgi:hypothetical protein
VVVKFLIYKCRQMGRFRFSKQNTRCLGRVFLIPPSIYSLSNWHDAEHKIPIVMEGFYHSGSSFYSFSN